jgi:hypothetical protein
MHREKQLSANAQPIIRLEKPAANLLSLGIVQNEKIVSLPHFQITIIRLHASPIKILIGGVGYLPIFQMSTRVWSRGN